MLSCRVLLLLLAAPIDAATPITHTQSTSLGDVACWDIGDAQGATDPFTLQHARRAQAMLRLMPRMLYRRSILKGLVHRSALDSHQMEVFLRDDDDRSGKERLWQNISRGTPKEMFATCPDIMKNIAVPTLLIHGQHDPCIPIEHAHRMDEDIPDSELVIIEHGAHFLPIDTPEEVAGVISAFLAPEEAP